MLSTLLRAFRKPTASELRAAMLEEAQRELVNAQFAAEHYAHEVAKLKARISRIAKEVRQ